MARALVCGGRDFQDAALLFQSLDDLRQMDGITSIVHGGAQGADALARQWAWQAGIPEVPFPADWALYGRAAGPRRNQQMIDEGKPDLVVAFPGGRGTEDMLRRARKAGIRIVEISLTPADPPSLG